jgi:hypothetical protein
MIAREKGGVGGDRPLLYCRGDRRMEGGSGVERRRVEVGEGGCWYDAPSSWGVGRGGDTGPGTAARVRAAPQHKAGEWVVADWWARYSTGRQGQMGLNPIRISNEFKLFQKPSKFWMIQKVPF